MSLCILAYNLKRMISILGVQSLIATIRVDRPRVVGIVGGGTRVGSAHGTIFTRIRT